MQKETSEIAKLTGRISKDPKSKLFVPLAEEYKKAGDIEMAIYVLMEGLKSNPEYVTARTSLGKLLMAKGDLAGAQKEFEEVVKTIPDNLMAQRKLGDLFLLQNRPNDALPHFKTALSLNPGDGELASLITDVEAGRDVSSKIQGVKAKTTDSPAAKQEPPSSGTAPEPAPKSLPPQTSNIDPIPPVEIPAAIQTAAPAPALPVTPEMELPEDIFVVEPLELENVAQEIPSGIIPPAELALPVVPSIVAGESLDFDFPAGEQIPDESAISRDIRPEMELPKFEDKGTIPANIFEETAADKIVGTGFDEEVQEKTTELSFKEISGKSDDFTTDTLAELYISQGFFEKAVEIYERMLVDRPNSQGLRDKLSWVRTELSRTADPASVHKKEADIFAFTETQEYVPAAGVGEVLMEKPEERPPYHKEETTGFKPEVVAEAREYVPAVETGDVFAEPLEGRPSQQKEETKGSQPEVAAEAREYVPKIEPEEILLEAEVVAVPGEFEPGGKVSEENIFDRPRDFKPAAEPIEQTTAGRDTVFDVLTDSPVQTRSDRKKDFEPREYVPPEMEQEPLRSPSQQEGATTVLGIAGRKETIARLETWLTTIKKEK